MKAKFFATATLLLATGAAFAQSDLDQFIHEAQQQKSTLTREQVKAEVLAARANGELDFNEAQYGGYFDTRATQRAQATMTATAKAKKAAQ